MWQYLRSHFLQKFSKSSNKLSSDTFAMGQSVTQQPRRSFIRNVKAALQSSAAPVHVLNAGASPGQIIFFPQELIGGICPWVDGQEEDIVWHAAAAACGTERVHAVWQVHKGKIFYLAIKSEEMASHYDTWCPFAALLPGMKDAIAAPVCYTYYANGSAAMMVVTSDNLQIYRGISLIARAKAERASRELNNAPIIELTSDRVAQLTPSPWRSVSLFEDQSRRILAAVSIMGALALAGLAFLIWLYASFSFIGARITLATHQDHVEADISQFVETVHENPLHSQLADFVRINDGLLALDGLMVTYEIKNGLPYWRAVVNASVPAETIKELDAITIEPAHDGKMTIGQGTEGAPVPLSSKGQ